MSDNLPIGEKIEPGIKTLNQVKLEYVYTVLNVCNGNLTETARVLQISRASLYRYRQQISNTHFQK